MSILVALTLTSCNESKFTDHSDSIGIEKTSKTGEYDEDLAKEYGADDYGMKSYVMAFLLEGPNRDQSEEEASNLQRAHMDNMGVLADEGKLVLAGPFGADSNIRGIYIFNTASLEEAEEWTKTDPAIQAGRLKMELHEWYGSAALMAINELHTKIAKMNI